jgi:hypothetical protein
LPDSSGPQSSTAVKGEELHIVKTDNGYCPMQIVNLFVGDVRCDHTANQGWEDKLAKDLTPEGGIEDTFLKKVLHEVNLGFKEALYIAYKAGDTFRLDLDEWSQLVAIGTRTNKPKTIAKVKYTPEQLVTMVNDRIAKNTVNSVKLRYEFTQQAISRVSLAAETKFDMQGTKVSLKAVNNKTQVEVAWGINQKSVDLKDLKPYVKHMRQSTLTTTPVL